MLYKVTHAAKAKAFLDELSTPRCALHTDAKQTFLAGVLPPTVLVSGLPPRERGRGEGLGLWRALIKLSLPDSALRLQCGIL